MVHANSPLKRAHRGARIRTGDLLLPKHVQGYRKYGIKPFFPVLRVETETRVTPVNRGLSLSKHSRTIAVGGGA